MKSHPFPVYGAHGSWLHSFRNIENLSFDNRPIVPDLPDYRNSASPGRHASAGEITGPSRTGSVRGSFERVQVLGFSLGGTNSCHVAAQVPDVVERVIISDTGGLDTPMLRPDVIAVRSLEKMDARHLRADATRSRRVDALSPYVRARGIR